MDLKNFKFNDYSKIIIFIAAVAIIFGIDYFVYRVKEKPADNSPQIIETEGQSSAGNVGESGVAQEKDLTISAPLKQEFVIEKSGEGVQRNVKYGFEFKYPASIFKPVDSGAGVILSSPYSFIGTFSGREEDRFVHNFSINMEIYQMAILDAIKKDLPYAFASTFPDKTVSSFVKMEGFADKYALDGKNGFVFWIGAEGIDNEYVYVPKSEKETLVIRLKSIGDMLKPNISEKEQIKIFNDLMASFRFIK